MKSRSCAVLLINIPILFGCQPDTPESNESARKGNSVSIAQSLNDQAHLIQLVKKSEIANNERSLVHVSHTCTLAINEEAYVVIDMRELVAGATTPRGINQILILNPEHQLVNKIEYGNARPLFCEDNKLYLHGDVIPDGQATEGNVLVFADSGFEVTAVKEDLNTLLLAR